MFDTAPVTGSSKDASVRLRVVAATSKLPGLTRTMDEELAKVRRDTAHPAGFDLRCDIRIARGLRNLRKTLLGPDLYSGAPWEILLYLYESSVLQRRDTVGNVTTSADLPPTTVLRWIDRLEQHRLICTHDDHLDARRRYVELTERGRELMSIYFSGAVPHSIAA